MSCIADTATVDLTISLGTLSAGVNVSVVAGNALAAVADGLYVADPWPTASIIMSATATLPAGWLVCNGDAVSRATYAALYSSIGTVFGAGDGTTTFNLPDFRGRVPVGLGTNASCDVLGENDGVAVANRRPQHQHTPHKHSLDLWTNAGNSVVPTASSATVQIAGGETGTKDGGSGVATDSVDAPAYLVVRYLIHV